VFGPWYRYNRWAAAAAAAAAAMNMVVFVSPSYVSSTRC
jgi:hypothetical protein